MRRKNMKKTAALFLLSIGVNCMTAQDIVPVHEFDIDIQKVGSQPPHGFSNSKERFLISSAYNPPSAPKLISSKKEHEKNRGFIPHKCRYKLHDRTRHRSCP